jgi:hypothetical protein
MVKVCPRKTRKGTKETMVVVKTEKRSQKTVFLMPSLKNNIMLIFTITETSFVDEFTGFKQP